jgi:hypothetical protein
VERGSSGNNEQLPTGQEFFIAARRLLARRGQIEKLLTHNGVFGSFGELSIFVRLAAKVDDVFHAMFHLSHAANQAT